MARPGLRHARAALLAAGIAGAPLPAFAGDAALLDILGYSEDGKYLAFEEFGVQYGSVFAYSSIYIVDLAADEWVYGSPFDAQADGDHPDRPLAAVRAEAREKADERLEPLGITQPAEVLVLLGDGVPDADGKAMTFADPRGGPPLGTLDGLYGLALDTFPAGSRADCETILGHKAMGFALVFDSPDAQAIEVHRDGDTIPRSRGCVVDYRLYAVVEPFQTRGNRVAFISTYPFGFEGPDRRFIAVPLDPPK
jgi:predicted secreted protein